MRIFFAVLAIRTMNTSNIARLIITTVGALFLVGCESAGSAWNNIKDGFKPAGKSTGTRLVERYPVEVGENYVFEVTGSTIGQVWVRISTQETHP